MRPKITIGSTISGITSRTMPDSFRLVSTSMPIAPTSITMLRSATDTVEPNTFFTCVVSAVSRASTSPDWASS